MWDESRVIVFGASSMLGSELCRRAKQEGLHYIAIARKGDNMANLAGLVFHEVDLADEKSLEVLVYSLPIENSLVINADYQSCLEYDQSCAIRFSRLVKNAKSFVQVISVQALSTSTNHLKTEQSSYDVAEVKDAYGKAYARWANAVLETNPHCRIALITRLIGPGDYTGKEDGFFRYMSQTSLKGCFSYNYDFVDVRDVALAILKMASYDADRQSFILCGHYCCNIEVINRLRYLVGNKPIRRTGFVYEIVSLLKTHQFHKTMWVPAYKTIGKLRNQWSNDKAKRLLDFKVRPLEESLRDMVDHWATTKVFL